MIAQRDRLWVAMAREAAHQMGTPLTSLQGWIERIRSRPTPPRSGRASCRRRRAAGSGGATLRAHRQPCQREPIGLGALADRVAGYFRPGCRNAPTHRAPARGERARARWCWAIRPARVGARGAGEERDRRAAGARGDDYSPGGERTHGIGEIRVLDDGPGVPRISAAHSSSRESRRSAAGWGIGLALSRRVVEDAHRGVRPWSRPRKAPAS